MSRELPERPNCIRGRKLHVIERFSARVKVRPLDYPWVRSFPMWTWSYTADFSQWQGNQPKVSINFPRGEVDNRVRLPLRCDISSVSDRADAAGACTYSFRVADIERVPGGLSGTFELECAKARECLTVSPEAAKELADKLRDMKLLLEEGVISQDEFDRFKKSLKA